MTTISPNYAGVNFRATEQVQPKKAETANAQSKPESKGMSNAMKVGFGAGALAVATTVIAGIAIKNKNSAKKVAQMAEKVGLTPTAYKKLSPNFQDIKKYETLDYEDVYNSLKDIHKTKMKINKGDHLGLIKMSDLKMRTDAATDMGLVANDIPENSVLMSIIDKETGEDKYNQLFIFDKMSQGLKDIFKGESVHTQEFVRKEI